jgi:hypothetical protein
MLKSLTNVIKNPGGKLKGSIASDKIQFDFLWNQKLWGYCNMEK